MHYTDIIMSAMASQITSVSTVYSTVGSGADQRKYQSSASLALVWVIHRSPVISPHKGPVTGKMLPFDDVIMDSIMRMISIYLYTQCLILHKAYKIIPTPQRLLIYVWNMKYTYPLASSLLETKKKVLINPSLRLCISWSRLFASRVLIT